MKVPPVYLGCRFKRSIEQEKREIENYVNPKAGYHPKICLSFFRRIFFLQFVKVVLKAVKEQDACFSCKQPAAESIGRKEMFVDRKIYNNERECDIRQDTL